MNSKEALETLGNVKVAVTTIRSSITHFKTLKEQYEAEFEVLERELFIRKKLKDFDVYQIQLEKLEKENQELRNIIKILKDKIELPLENDFDVVNKDDIHLYRLRTKCLINEKEYDLLKEVLENE